MVDQEPSAKWSENSFQKSKRTKTTVNEQYGVKELSYYESDLVDPNFKFGLRGLVRKIKCLDASVVSAAKRCIKNDI